MKFPDSPEAGTVGRHHAGSADATLYSGRTARESLGVNHCGIRSGMNIGQALASP